MYPTILPVLAWSLLGYMPIHVGAQTTDIPSNYTINGATRSFSGQFFVAIDNDTSAILVENYGKLTLTGCSVAKTGESSDMANSSFSDLNAAVAVQSNGTLTMHDSVISSYGQSANVLHIYESGSSAYIYNSIVSVYDILSHGLYVAGGYLYAENCIITTAGMFSGAISTDMGGGTMVIKNSQAHTLNKLAACTYSTGNVLSTA